jgi:hypothetical protein
MRGSSTAGLICMLLAACGGATTTDAGGGLAAPRGLTATPAARASAIDLAWAPSRGATGYRVYRSAQRFQAAPGAKPAPGERARAPWARFEALTVLGGPDVSANAYHDADVSAETVYFYRVTALRAAEESAPSAAVTAAARRFNRPPAPTAAALETTKNAQGWTRIEPHDPNVNDAHTFTLTSAPAHGRVAISRTGFAVYEPAPGFDGADTFSVAVADAFGGVADVTIPVTVSNRPPSPRDADLYTFKNMPAAFWLDPRDPDVGEHFAYGVTAAAAHGGVSVSAGGFVVYTPGAQYVGADAFALVVTDSSGVSHGLRVTVLVSNRPPRPLIAPLITERDTVGGSAVLAQDPDPGEMLAFTLVTGPTHGDAALALDGYVTYTPHPGYMGPDYLVVQVVDGSGAGAYLVVPIVVDQSHLPAGMSFPLPADACGDGLTRVLITGVSPAAFTTFTPGQDVRFDVTLSYSTPVTQVIGASFGAYGAAITTVEPGCGTVSVWGMANGVSSAFWVEPSPNVSRTAVQYLVGNAPAARAAFTTVALAKDSFIRTPTFDFAARIAFDLQGDAGAWNSLVRAEPVGGQLGYRAQFYTSVPAVNGLPLRLRGALDCGEGFATFEVVAQRASPLALWAYSYLAFPAALPAVRVDNFATNVPVADGRVTQLLNLHPCGGATAVTFTTSAPWFSVAPTRATLAAYLETPVAVTVDGGAIVSYGAPVTGTLWMWPDAGAAFAPVPIAVSAVRHALDFAAFTRVGLAGSDDGAALVALPFAFPFGGRTYGHVEVTANGTVNLTEAPCMYDWRNLFGPFQPYAPGRFGCPVLAPLWSDLGFGSAYLPGERVPDVYVRESAGAMEILFWDLQSHERFYTHNVILVRLYPDGRYTYEYPQIDAYGLESVGWWDAAGVSGPVRFAGSLQAGDTLSFDPVP